MEERIPGINADADDHETLGAQHDLQESQFVAKRVQSAESSVSDKRQDILQVAVITEGAPRDLQNQCVPGGSESNISTEESALAAKFHSPTLLDIIRGGSSEDARGLAASCSPSVVSIPTEDSDSDDLYFDDGIIAHPEEVDMYGFDESVFDEETTPFYDHSEQKLRASSGPNLESSDTYSSSPPLAQSTNEQEAGVIIDLQSLQPVQPPLMSLDEIPGSTPNQGFLEIGEQKLNKIDPIHAASLTQDNLAAYHVALAYATHQVTADEQFIGKQSTVQTENTLPSRSSLETTNQVRHAVTSNNDCIGYDADSYTLETSGEGEDSFNYDDALEDDPIIAAANAEALENDDEGFYGQEFGFYAQSSGNGEAQYVHGGYFGPRGVDGITRSHSGRVNFQEPSLTPITERSEFSNRNSVASLGLYGASHPVAPHSAGPLPSPGLAQLADLMHLEEDDDMSLSALMKLRRGAWGGSNTSLRSSTNSQRSGSPASYGPTLGLAGIPSTMNASSYSLASSNGGSDDGSPPPSPTITLQTQGLGILAPAPAEKSSGADSSPVRRSAVRGKGHNRNSSGADSVSYIKEKTEEGGARWVVEKRRTADTGQVEILGRELVVGGRI